MVSNWQLAPGNLYGSGQRKPSWFEAVIPLPAVILLVLLIFILPIFVLTAESLFVPVLEFLQSIFSPVNSGTVYNGIPLQLILKIIIFSAFTFSGVTLLILKIDCLYHTVWSAFLVQPHPLHTPYHPDQQESMVALFNWNMFRWGHVFGIPLLWIAGTIAVTAFMFWFVNLFTGFGVFTFQLQFTLAFFVVSVLLWFTFLKILRAIGTAFQTILGDVAAITEPEKPTQIIFDRAKTLAFKSPWILILYPLYLIFYLAVFAEIVFLVMTFDIIDLLALKPELLWVFLLTALTLAVFIALNALKFITYHHALSRFYHQARR